MKNRISVKTYTNQVFVFVFNYPSDWKLDSKALDQSKTVLEAFQKGVTKLTLSKKIDKKIYQISLSFLPTSLTPSEIAKQDKSYVEKEKRVGMGEWTIGTSGQERAKIYKAIGIYEKIYPETENLGKYLTVQITSSAPSDQERDINTIINSFRFIRGQ